MGLSALTRTTGGVEVVPSSSDDWDVWCSATSIRNYILKEPLVDWLNRYGKDKGFTRDTDCPDYDERLDFAAFIMRKGLDFEAAVANYLRSIKKVTTIAEPCGEIRDLVAAERTFQALADGREIIHQAVLRDPDSKTYGAVDFLIRSDILNSLFPDDMNLADASAVAPDLNGSWHYVAVDTKFTTLRLDASGGLGNSGSAPAYKAQLYIYNRALGRLQGYTPPRAFLLGRNWEQKSKRGTGAMERLAPVSMSGDIGARVEAAAEWLRRMRMEGGKWNPLPHPSVPELWPNVSGIGGAWSGAIKRIADELGELTQLWYVGPDKRDKAVCQGIYSWRDTRTTSSVLDVTSEKLGPKLQAILDVNQTNDGPPVRPPRINTQGWRAKPALEFFVDFETVNNLNDDFSAFPKQGGQALIFMIGCGHMENGKWVLCRFIADRLNEASEAQIIEEWLAHMNQVRSRMGDDDALRIIHWSDAEATTYDKSYDAARKRHSGKGWPDVNWFDLLKQVIRCEPVVVRGSLNFSLKTFARALHDHGLIKTSWGDLQVDGLGAMTSAWWCDRYAAEKSLSLADIDLMAKIADYNEVDCKVIMEILYYLRKFH